MVYLLVDGGKICEIKASDSTKTNSKHSKCGFVANKGESSRIECRFGSKHSRNFFKMNFPLLLCTPFTLLSWEQLIRGIFMRSKLHHLNESDNGNEFNHIFHCLIKPAILQVFHFHVFYME